MPPVRGYNATVAAAFKRVLGKDLPSGPMRAFSFIANPGPDAANFTIQSSTTDYGPAVATRDGMCARQRVELPANMRVKGAPIGFPIAAGNANGRLDTRAIRVSETVCGTTYRGDSIESGGAFNVTNHNGVPVLADPDAVSANACGEHQLWIRAPSTKPRYESEWIDVQSLSNNARGRVDRTHDVGIQDWSMHELYGEILLSGGINDGFVVPTIYATPFSDYYNPYFGGVGVFFNSTEFLAVTPTSWRYGSRKYVFYNPFDQSSGAQYYSTGKLRVRIFDDLSEPDYDSGWFGIGSQRGTNSHRSFSHGLADTPSKVRVMIRNSHASSNCMEGWLQYAMPNGFTYDLQQYSYTGTVYTYN